MCQHHQFDSRYNKFPRKKLLNYTFCPVHIVVVIAAVTLLTADTLEITRSELLKLKGSLFSLFSQFAGMKNSDTVTFLSHRSRLMFSIKHETTS